MKLTVATANQQAPSPGFLKPQASINPPSNLKRGESSILNSIPSDHLKQQFNHQSSIGAHQSQISSLGEFQSSTERRCRIFLSLGATCGGAKNISVSWSEPNQVFKKRRRTQGWQKENNVSFGWEKTTTNVSFPPRCFFCMDFTKQCGAECVRGNLFSIFIFCFLRQMRVLQRQNIRLLFSLFLSCFSWLSLALVETQLALFLFRETQL